MKVSVLAGSVVVAALGVRVVRSRHQRSLHPVGRSFAGELEVWGTGRPEGADLLDNPGLHRVTVRISKGVGTGPGRPDVLGLAVRVHWGRPVDLLMSTCGTGRLGRHVPMPRRAFDAVYGSIQAYRTGGGRKIYLSARPDPEAKLGDDLAAIRSGRITLSAGDRPFGRVTFDSPLTADEDDALAFDPIRNTLPDLHPIGLIHRSRAAAYPLSQRWRRVRPAGPAPDAVARTVAEK